jgi:hypothetical protein
MPLAVRAQVANKSPSWITFFLTSFRWSSPGAMVSKVSMPSDASVGQCRIPPQVTIRDKLR